MTDIVTREEREELRRLYEAAKSMPEHGISAAKRVNVDKSDWMDDWWVGYGKDESCQIEGTQNHWRWLAMLILGLADPLDRPYTEDKPTPEIVPALLDTIDALEAENERLRKPRCIGCGRTEDELHASDCSHINGTLALTYEQGIRDVLRIRCVKHHDVPQYNRNEINGGECAACAVEDEAAMLRESCLDVAGQNATLQEALQAIWQLSGLPFTDNDRFKIRWIAQTYMQGGGPKPGSEVEAWMAALRTTAATPEGGE